MVRYLTLAVCLAISGVANALPFQQLGGGVQHTGVCETNYSPEDWHSAWVGAPPAGTSFNPAQQPVVTADGSTVFVVADSADGENWSLVCALDVQTGDIKWTKEVDSFVGYWSWSSLAYSDGYVYWAGSDGIDSPMAYKIDAMTGQTTGGGWEVSFGVPGDSIVNASPLIVNDRFYISTYGGFSPEYGKHFALNLTDGSVSWSNSDGGQGQGAMVYDPDRNAVYQTVYDAVDSDQEMRGYDADSGLILWTTDVGFGTGTYGAPFQCAIAYASDMIYFQDYNFYGNGHINVLDAANSGAVIWSAETPAAGDSCPAVDPEGNVYTRSDYMGDGQTRGFDAEGNVLWTFTQAGGWQGSVTWCNEVVYIGQQIYGVPESGTLYLLDDSTGEVIRDDLKGSGPVSFGDGWLFSVGGDGQLYTAQAPEPGTWCLFALGLGALVMAVRRRRAAAE